MHALQRANSFQAPRASKYQNWRRKFQSNLMPVNNKRTMLPAKEPSPLSISSLSSSSSPPSSSSSASVLGNAADCSSHPQVRAYNHASQVSRDHFSPSTPIFLRRARTQGAFEEIPLYLPHHQVLERAEYCPVRPGEDGLPHPEPPSPGEMASPGCKEAEAPLGDTRSTHRGPHSIGGKDQCLPDQELSPRVGGHSGERNVGPRRGDGGSELPEGKKPGLQKLVLTHEQKNRLLDWSDSNLHLEAGERLSRKSADSGVGGCVLKPVRPLRLPQAARETLPAQGAQEKTGCPAQRAPGEQSVAPPKSPLRLIARAIWRSLEPLRPNPEGGKKVWAKPESKTLPANQPRAWAHPCSLQKTGFSKDWGQQSSGRDMASRPSVFSPGFPATRAAQASDPSPPDPARCTPSLPNRLSRIFPALRSPCSSKFEDVPTLLEKVSLQETSPDASRVPKRRLSLFSSFRLKDKPFESFVQESRQGKDLRDGCSSPKGTVLPGDNAQPLEKLLQPLSGASRDQAVHPPAAARSGPKHIPVRAQVTEAASSASSTTSSSADEEFDPQPSLRSKERKILKRRRKLEKATKQLIKQEELKRLHKAQAIQRQLEEVEEWQRAYEIQGVKLEKALRGEADSGTQDEAQLLQEWFKLVLEKNKLIRYESELQIMAQELELEDHQSRLEQKLREKMLKEESQKDENDLNEEQEIFTEMMQVIEQRDKLVDSLEEQRVKEKAEDQQFESVMLSRGCPLSRT
ncbi:MICAL C-terminal-like protein [Choloepus didactylus]|uniref:MICAL C-terminal-like protein n=1 Tax=Choloepus didactylus TaxID=27675 RepID=UPI00189F760F|nr:MICAL C-terminal-like protein [Choloepus didactylus]